MEDWAEEMLAGVDTVHFRGSPGTMVVYGEEARPILTNSKCQVLMGAATFDRRGRLVVFSHSGLVSVKNFTQDDGKNYELYQNTKDWLMGGECPAEVRVEDATAIEGQSSDHEARILVVGSGSSPSGALCARLTEFLLAGGAVVIGVTPWGLLQTEKNHTLDTLPVNVFIKQAGIAFTPAYFDTRKELLVSENCADYSHIVKTLTGEVNVEDFEMSAISIQENLRWLPEDQFLNLEDEVLECISNLRQRFSGNPTPRTPARSPEEKALVTLLERALLSFGQVEGETKIPSVETFPGDLDSPPPMVQCAEVFLPLPEHGEVCYHPTGYYVPAGMSLAVTLLDEPPEEGEQWTVAVGSHTDQLFTVNAPWRRWPALQVKKVLNEQSCMLRTSSGGLVYFVSDETTRVRLWARLENVVTAPYFDLNDPELMSESHWNLSRASPGLWADLVGEHIMLTVPAWCVRHLEDPRSVLVFWDEVVAGHYALAGRDVRAHRREWMLCDEQPRAGYMHAGYPVVTGLDVADPDHERRLAVSLLNASGLREKGNWGVFHELGHNVQDPLWTFEGTGEVTCNIFTLHAMDVLVGEEPWIHPWLRAHTEAVEGYLRNGANFSEWQHGPHIAIFIYAQLARDFGWETYRRVFRRYRELQNNEKPRGLQQKIDTWIRFFSDATGYNLCPVFEFWGFPISDGAWHYLQKYKSFLHCDETCNIVPRKTVKLMRKYKINISQDVGREK